MARRPRIELAGGIHHVTARGNRGQPVFRVSDDRHRFLDELRRAAGHFEWAVLAYCLMDNHVHLVVETPTPTLGQGMQRIIGRYAQAFNQRHGTYGHVFQGRFGSVLVRDDAHLANVLRYVARNPVAAGLCRRPVDWPWSSHRARLAAAHDPITARARTDALLGSGGYAALFDPAGDVPASALRPPLHALLHSDEAIRSARAHGYTLAEISSALGVHRSTVLRRVRRASA